MTTHAIKLGMDEVKHGEPAYPISAWKEAWGDFEGGELIC